MTAASPCPACGAPAPGRFCSRCGAAQGDEAGCRACGSRLSPGAMYCGDCGQAVAARSAKGVSARVPWILSGVTLAAFSVIIALLVQGQSRPRVGDMLPTGNLPGAAGGAGAVGRDADVAGGATSAMPSLEELEAMGPRAAADRLFERAMSEHEQEDLEGAARFIAMGLQAYAAVPADEVDADLRFHVGLLQLVAGDAEGAAASAAATLETEPDHLLALILAARVADFRQDSAAAAEFRSRLFAALESAGGVPDLPEYKAHRPIIDRELERPGS